MTDSEVPVHFDEFDTPPIDIPLDDVMFNTVPISSSYMMSCWLCIQEWDVSAGINVFWSMSALDGSEQTLYY